MAHRLSTVRGANKIVVISDGKVVEEGTHNDLMALKSEYYNLVTTQLTSSDYIESLNKSDDDNVEFEDMRKISIADQLTDVGPAELSLDITLIKFCTILG